MAHGAVQAVHTLATSILGAIQDDTHWSPSSVSEFLHDVHELELAASQVSHGSVQPPELVTHVPLFSSFPVSHVVQLSAAVAEQL